jgi:hypothetical protein
MSRMSKERFSDLAVYRDIKHGTPEDYCLRDCVLHIDAVEAELDEAKKGLASYCFNECGNCDDPEQCVLLETTTLVCFGQTTGKTRIHDNE